MIEDISKGLNDKVQAGSQPQPNPIFMNTAERAARTNSVMNKRANSIGTDPHADLINKFDPKLKHQLMDEQSAKVSRARRDADDARKKAEAAF